MHDNTGVCSHSFLYHPHDSRLSFFDTGYHFLIQVNLNGVLSFKEKFNIPHPQPFPYKSLAMISPYWANFDTSRNGDVYYRTTKDSTLLKRAQYHLQSIFTSARDFSPSYLVIVTWDRVPELGLAGNPKLVRTWFSLSSLAVADVQNSCARCD